MDGALYDNDISHVVDADRAHVWHHLIQHKPFETNDPRIIVEGKGIDGSFNNGKDVYSITNNMKDRKLSFSSTNISSPPLPPPPSSSSLSTATKMSQVAEFELNASVISMNESVNSINMSSVPIRRVVKSQMRCRSDSLKHLTIPEWNSTLGFI